MTLLTNIKQPYDKYSTTVDKNKKTIIVCFVFKNRVIYVLTLSEFNEIFFLNKNRCGLNKSAIITYIKTFWVAFLSSNPFLMDATPVTNSSNVPDLLYIEFSYILNTDIMEDIYLNLNIVPVKRINPSDFYRLYVINKNPAYKKPVVTHRLKDFGVIAFTRGALTLIDNK